MGFKAERCTIHCSQTPNGKRYSIDLLRQWHIAKGWKDIGYHLVVQPDGEQQNGRALNVQGAHVGGENENNIGICLIGTDKFTHAQFDSLRNILSYLVQMFGIPEWEIHCHYEFRSARGQGKTCPNMNIHRVLDWYYRCNNVAISPYIW